MEWLRAILRRPWLILGLPFLVMVWTFWFLCDDAYITYRYAKNLAWGHGIRFNLGDELPVEGYSNFLWLLVAAACEVIGLDPAIITPLLSIAASGAAVALTFHICVRHLRLDYSYAVLAGLALVLLPPWAVWTTSGLATAPFAALVLFTFHQLVLTRYQTWWFGAGFAAMLLSLIRVEGIAWVAVLTVLAVVAHYLDDDRERFRAWLTKLPYALALVAPVYAVYTIWRWSHFGTLVPNTALVKVDFGLARLERGGLYLALLTATFPVVVTYYLGMLPAWRWRRGAGLALAAMAVAFPAYAVVVGGDYMPFGRLIIPSLPFACILLALLVADLADRVPDQAENLLRVAFILMATNVLGGFSLSPVPKSAQSVFHFRWTDRSFMTERERWDKMVANTDGFILRGKALRDNVAPDATLVAQAVGAVGYFSDLYIYDQYGLVTREVAERELPEGPSLQSPGHDKLVPPEWFVHREPDIIRAKVVHSVFADKRIRDVMDFWDVPLHLREQYAPELIPISYPGEDEYLYLLLVRKVAPSDTGSDAWARFQRQVRELSDELKAVRRTQRATEDVQHDVDG